MDNRKWQSGAAGSAPAVEASPSTGFPTDGNPGTATPATVPGARWFHQVGEELRNLISAAGLTPSDSDLTQLQQAISALISQGGIKTPVRAATTGNIASLAGGAPNTLDGVTLAANDRILVKNQSTGSQNGLYVVTTLGTGANGTWTRATDADGVGELVAGMLVVVQEGTISADSIWELSTDGTITIGTTDLTFLQRASLPASNAEAQAMTNQTKVITPATLAAAFQGGNQSIVTNGYQKLPGGLILQWGTGNTTGTPGSGSVTWPIAFQTAVTGFAASSVSANPAAVGQSSISTSGATVSSSGPTAYRYIVVGY